MEALSSTTSWTLEVTVISGEDLMVSRTLPVKKNAFVTVRTDDSGAAINTGMEKQGGEGYIAWNEKLMVHFPMHAHYLTLEVHCKTFSGKKFIGVAKIPTSDFLGGMVPENYLHLLSYRLRNKHGEKNGIINISIVMKQAGISGIPAWSVW